MSQEIATPLTLEGFVFQDEQNIAHKLSDMTKLGAKGLHVVFDFDRTLTVAKPGSNEDITTWHIMKSHLPETGQERYQSLFQHYRALELKGAMTEQDAIAWWSGILNLFVDNGINMSDVESDFLSKATIRPAAKELFDLCNQLDIPTVIMSAGIKDVIEIWARAYNISPTIILSTELILNSAGVVAGWDEKSLVHVLNKKELGHPTLSQIRSARPYTIAIGDSIDDADMASGDDVFRIRILDRRTDETSSIEAERGRSFRRFDAIIESGNLQPVCNLLGQVALR